MTVLEAGGEQKVIAKSELEDEVYATPAIADHRIYLRSKTGLWCFGQQER